MPNVEIDGTNSTVKTDVLTSQSGTAITVPTGKVLTVIDAAGLTVAGTAPLTSIEKATVEALDIELPAANLTGDIALARLGNAPATDLTPVKNDISLLALQTAMNGNMSAYGLKNSWIEQFENSTYIDNLTQSARVTADEYMASVYTQLSTPAYIEGDRRSRITVTNSGWSPSQGTITNILKGDIGENASNAILGTAYNVTNTGHYFQFDFGSGGEKAVTEAKWYRNAPNNIGNWQWSGSDTAGSGYVNIGSPFACGGIASGAHPGTPNILTELSSNITAYRYYRMTGTGSGSTNNNWDSEIYFKEATVTTSNYATGSFTSTVIIPQDTTNKSSVGLVILYKEQAGSNHITGSKLTAKVRANASAGYVATSLATAGTYSDGLKIAIAPAVTVTAGQALSYELSFAGQASGSIETRVYGVAMTY